MPWRWAISNHKGRDFHKTTAGPKCWLRAFLKLRNCTLKFRTIRLGESYLHQNRRFGSSRVFCRDIQSLSVQKCTLLVTALKRYHLELPMPPNCGLWILTLTWYLWFSDIDAIQESGKIWMFVVQAKGAAYVSCQPKERFSTRKENRRPNLKRADPPNSGSRDRSKP